MQLFNLDTPTPVHLAINLIFIKSTLCKLRCTEKVLKVSKIYRRKNHVV